jgi:ABC-2 type transport system permease protein
MSFRRILPVIRKEFIEIGRDPVYLTLLLILPAFILILYGYALNFDVKHLPLAVVDENQSRLSRELIDKITSGEYFDLKYRLNSSSEIDPLLDQEKIKLALVIPVDFSRKIVSGRNPEVQVIVDGTNSTSATTGLGYLSSILQQYSLNLNLKLLEKAGAGVFSFPVDSRIRVWYNPELRSSKFLVPGLMAFILMIIIVLAASLSIVREKEKETIEQLLLSPLNPAEMILGKIIPYLILSLIGAHLVLLAGRVLFGITIKGSYPVLLLVLVIFLFCGLSQGLLISALATSQQVAFLLAGISTLLPTFILSGFVFPIRNMPVVIQAITYLIPARYFLVCLRAIILKGVGPEVFYREIIFLSLYALILTLFSLGKLKRSFRR